MRHLIIILAVVVVFPLISNAGAMLVHEGVVIDAGDIKELRCWYADIAGPVGIKGLRGSGDGDGEYQIVVVHPKPHPDVYPGDAIIIYTTVNMRFIKIEKR